MCIRDRCKEHGLSVVVPGQDKGKSYAEYTAEKQGTSYKAKLKDVYKRQGLGYSRMDIPR